MLFDLGYSVIGWMTFLSDTCTGIIDHLQFEGRRDVESGTVGCKPRTRPKP